ncbi:hypothetical protein SAMN04488029_1160 [Reichenbachiella faecimaris]|uniref:Uncharacterized protein n=1 Tax=Reichenbachiella faecimaris TaxID=692418 RepID=A0A1W2G7Z9_REIFA|nr:hypothetical protein [Reichenbachiella faecimaris]SMD32809.1 hypothetical protein SAMN04488029_1160 [Reichenbachiella faecimaris]
MNWNNKLLILAICLNLVNTGCSEEEDTMDETTAIGDYTGTGSVTQGLGTTTVSNLFPDGQRIAATGTITASDDTEWILPAEVNFTDDSFPFASDLSNSYGNSYNSASEALAALDGSDIIEIDGSGEVITGFIFADNYFELYVNGEPVGKDAVPFTDFNSHIVRFRVERPFTLAMKLVDWEENLGLGSEKQATDYHAGDGGMVAFFQDEQAATIAITNSTWKAQTYYIAPVQDLSCLSEDGQARLSSSCSTADAEDGSDFYGVHWELPSDWMKESFDDSEWPSATTYTNNEIGVDNKESYTNFTDIFDKPADDAEFIWSSNVVLDNEVLVRYTVD